ncbi:MAG: threonine aldolase [Deltaproteobacteria bacterium RIFOXYA12_FULL_58_15]|nr:MAG: threonine aldolase [Deltaproteobacteria bacterium RIFOXYA12_FULL_58_15]OGR13657.1 MAG: threonine aldolase [Deltaproteobacteria bacterium RIFOXYB12_FULL_58_9]
MSKITDLRSDTVTLPSDGMREAMMRAKVGDDVYGEDPTVIELQRRVAELLGKEAGLFVPSGTMANQVSLRAHTEPGDEVILDAGGHSFNYESGATAALCGVQVRPITTETGVFTAAQLDEAVRPPAYYMPQSGLVIIENTNNYGGGTVWSVEQTLQVARRAHHHGLPVHLDGARLFNAQAATGVSVKEFAAPVDSASICLSKGLGAPVGSVVVGDRQFITKVHRFRKMFGGGMRQVGFLAAAGLYAIEHNVTRLVDDHKNAKRLAEGLAKLDGIELDINRVKTNMVFFKITRSGFDSHALLERMRKLGVLANPTGPMGIRLVTHLNVDKHDIDTAVSSIAEALNR